MSDTKKEYNFCTKCNWESECLLFFKGGRPPCGMVAEENLDTIKILMAEVAALAEVIACLDKKLQQLIKGDG